MGDGKRLIGEASDVATRCFLDDAGPVCRRDGPTLAHIAPARRGVALEAADLPEGSGATKGVDDLGNRHSQTLLRLLRSIVNAYCVTRYGQNGECKRKSKIA